VCPPELSDEATPSYLAETKGVRGKESGRRGRNFVYSTGNSSLNCGAGLIRPERKQGKSHASRTTG